MGDILPTNTAMVLQVKKNFRLRVTVYCMSVEALTHRRPCNLGIRRAAASHRELSIARGNEVTSLCERVEIRGVIEVFLVLPQTME